MRPDPKPERGRDDADAAARLDFRVAVLACDAGNCVVHHDRQDCRGELRAHHVVTQQQLRQAGRHDLLWDARNGATVCDLAHTRHHSGVERIPRARLPLRCIRFAAAEGFDAVLDRYYATNV